jgi:hypothetical protein
MESTARDQLLPGVTFYEKRDLPPSVLSIGHLRNQFERHHGQLYDLPLPVPYSLRCPVQQTLPPILAIQETWSRIMPGASWSPLELSHHGPTD